MSRMDKVVWSEGMFLTPQLFQQADRYHESLLHFALGAGQPFPWGLMALDIDAERLVNGDFSLVRASGLMPDGLAVRIPDHDPVPEVRAPVTRSDHLLEVNVPHVLRVVVPGNRDDAALDLLEVRGGRLELAAESFVGDVPGADDDVGLELVQLDDHAVQQVRNEVNGADVEVADVSDGDHVSLP